MITKKLGRPKTANTHEKEAAILRGDTTYISSLPCKKCGGTVRYANNGAPCVPCIKAQAKAWGRAHKFKAQRAYNERKRSKQEME